MVLKKVQYQIFFLLFPLCTIAQLLKKQSHFHFTRSKRGPFTENSDISEFVQFLLDRQGSIFILKVEFLSPPPT